MTNGMDYTISYYLLPIGSAVACVIAVLLAFVQKFDSPLPKYRIARAAKPAVPGGQSASDLPSIARRRYRFLKTNTAAGPQLSVLAVFAWFDRLVQTSGLSISSSRFGVIVLLGMAIVTLVVKRITDFGLLMVAAIVIPMIGLLTVQILLSRKAAYHRQFQTIFPDALDLIVRSVRAGLPVSESIRMIGAEVADPVGPSFTEVSANLTIGLSLDDALALLEQRIPIPEVKFFAISLTIQQETGGNLAEILSNLASIMRKRVQIGKKIRALSSEARASALIIGSLPFIVGSAIFVLNRQYIEILFVDETGRLFLLAALGSIGLGAAIMSKLIRFEI
jgi:tight adherence protein B